MALKDARVGIFTSSSGGGGFLTVYDKESTTAQMSADAYWNANLDTSLASETSEERARVKNLRAAMEDMVMKQASDPNPVAANTGGVAITLVGSGNQANSRIDRRAKLNSNTGRIQITN